MKVKKVIGEKRAALGKINSHEIQVPNHDLLVLHLKISFVLPNLER